MDVTGIEGIFRQTSESVIWELWEKVRCWRRLCTIRWSIESWRRKIKLNH